MKRSFLSRRTRLFFLGASSILATVVAVLTPNWQAVSNPAKPGMTETGPMPRLAEPASHFAEIEPAKNPIRLCLQDDGRKVLGISGLEELKGDQFTSRLTGTREAQTAHHRSDNTFTWKYLLHENRPGRVPGRHLLPSGLARGQRTVAQPWPRKEPVSSSSSIRTPTGRRNR